MIHQQLMGSRSDMRARMDAKTNGIKCELSNDYRGFCYLWREGVMLVSTSGIHLNAKKDNRKSLSELPASNPRSHLLGFSFNRKSLSELPLYTPRKTTSISKVRS